MAPLTSPLSIIMLNCNSLYTHLAEVKLLLYTQKPSILCLTETWVTDKYLPTFLGYSTYWCNRDGRGGGLCMLVNSSLCYQRLMLLPYPTGILEVQAISLRLRNATTISILNIYNPNGAVTLQELTSYTQQLTSPYLVVGDFNAHSPILSSRTNTPDATGRALEELLLTEPLTLMNPVDFHTYIDRRTGSPGCLDLVLVTSDVSPGFSLRCLPDVGSDHFPILATSELSLLNLDSVPVPRWKIAPNGLQQISACVPTSTIITPASILAPATELAYGFSPACSLVRVMGQLRQAIDFFWRHWTTYYLQSQSADRFPGTSAQYVPLQPGDKVLFKEFEEHHRMPGTPALQAATVKEVHPSEDQVIRRVTIVTKEGKEKEIPLRRVYLPEVALVDRRTQ